MTIATPDVGHNLVDNRSHALPAKACRALASAVSPDPAQLAHDGLLAPDA